MSFVFKFTPEKTHVFIHIPKNGGTALWKILGDYNPYINTKKRRPDERFVGHLTYRETKALFTSNEALSFFCIIRNPWDRIVSNYNYIKQTSPKKHGVRGIFNRWKKDMPFEEFVEYIVTSGQTKFKPQIDYMIDENNALAMDDIIRIDHYQQDLNSLLLKNGCDVSIEAKKHNASKHAHYTEYYKSEETIRLIEDYESGIIDLYNYSFGD
ncbi:MAG TPA: hypothetical protein DCX14_06910 [Flavobacteriales bacterium]|nr:hypothetical protein [Flavobacteriales bacterium]